jgi:hypothetical protein
MSVPPRADYVAGCPDCGASKEADSLEAVAGFYSCHHRHGHDVEWMWGQADARDVDVEVTDAGRVANLAAVVGGLESVFEPAAVPAELVYETCLSAGARKAAVDDQLQRLPDAVTCRVDSLK